MQERCLPRATQERHLSPADLAARESVPVGTVYDWNRDGTGPAYMKIGRHVRYRLADVVTWEDGRRIAPAGRVSA